MNIILHHFNFKKDNRAIVRVFTLEDYNKINPNNKMKEDKFGIIYIKEKDEFKTEDINVAFDYIPKDENVIHQTGDIPIEIQVKLIRKELMNN